MEVSINTQIGTLLALIIWWLKAFLKQRLKNYATCM